MKTEIQFGLGMQCAVILVPFDVLEKAGFSVGETVDIDIPMLGGGLRIDKIEQRVGDETV